MALTADILLNTSQYDIALSRTKVQTISALGDAGTKGGAAMAAGLKKSTTAMSTGLRSLAIQIPDVFGQLASGVSPLKVLIQQGPQVVEGMGGIPAVLKAVAGAAGPAVVGIGAVAAIVGTGAAAWYLYGADARNAAKMIDEITTSAKKSAEEVAKLQAIASGKALKDEAFQLKIAAQMGFDVAESQAKNAAATQVSAQFAERDLAARTMILQVEKELGQIKSKIEGGANTGEVIKLLARETQLKGMRLEAKQVLADVTMEEENYRNAIELSTLEEGKSTKAKTENTAATRDDTAAIRAQNAENDAWLKGARERQAAIQESKAFDQARFEANQAQRISEAVALDKQLADESAKKDAALKADLARIATMKQAQISTGLQVLGSIESLASAEVAARGKAAMGAVIAAKLAGAAQITINTAVAATKAYAELGPFGIPAAIALGVLGAIQAGKVLSAPVPAVPSYATGKVPTKNGESLGYIGDREAIINERGTKAAGPDVIRDLNRGRSPTTSTTVSLDGARVTGVVGSRLTTDVRESERMVHLSSGSLGTTGRASYR